MSDSLYAAQVSYLGRSVTGEYNHNILDIIYRNQVVDSFQPIFPPQNDEDVRILTKGWCKTNNDRYNQMLDVIAQHPYGQHPTKPRE